MSIETVLLIVGLSVFTIAGLMLLIVATSAFARTLLAVILIGGAILAAVSSIVRDEHRIAKENAAAYALVNDRCDHAEQRTFRRIVDLVNDNGVARAGARQQIAEAYVTVCDATRKPVRSLPVITQP